MNGWTSEHAAHLLRRAGFGGTPEEIARAADLGREGAVDSLLEFGKVPFSIAPPTVEPDAPQFGREFFGKSEEEKEALRRFYRANSRIHFQNLSGWWLRRMAATSDPLQEKLVLFWHGHFTSGRQEVKDTYKLYRQNLLFREHALGPFGILLEKIALDPAMLVYLDGVRNKRGRPNENFARELMELFTMGVGHYTEDDVKEAARAFTGWTVNPNTGEVVFRKGQHDSGEKRFLGEKGRFDGEDVIRIILKQPATSEFLARKLWSFFAAAEPSPETTRSLAETLRKSGYDLEPTLRAVFLADAFYAPELRFRNIKSPVELAVGTFRLLGCSPVDGPYFQQALKLMGQELFQPPNVKGWEGGAKWIDASSLFARYNFGYAALYGSEEFAGRKQREKLRNRVEEMIPEEMELSDLDGAEPQPPFDPETLFEGQRLDGAEAVVERLLRRFLQQEIAAEKKESLVRHFEEIGGLDGGPKRRANALRGLIHLIFSMPEYQTS